MSLFGKIMALLNVFGAIGLVVMATMDYTTRQTWAYHRLRHEIVLSGLPLDDHEQAPNGSQMIGLFGEDSLARIFKPVGGGPVLTQLQEVHNIKNDLDAKLLAVAVNKQAQSHLLSRILLPLAENHLEREQLLACRSHLATGANATAFKKRYVEAFREALKPPAADDLAPSAFPEAFRAAVRAQGGQPAQAFTSMLLKALPDDREKAKAVKIDAVFDTVLEEQRKQLEDRYNEMFTAAFIGPMPTGVKTTAEAQKVLDPETDKGKPFEAQKAYVARLLFGLCLFRAEDALATNAALRADAVLLQGLPPDGAKFGVNLTNTGTYRNLVKRVQLICGLRASLDAISAQTLVMRRLSDYLIGTVADERQLFVADHTQLVEQIRQRAYLLQQELEHKAESERKVTVQEEQVKKRQRDVKQHEDEYAELRAKTAESTKALRKLSQDLLDDRIKARDLIRLTEESEKTIRDLEKKIRELDSDQ